VETFWSGKMNILSLFDGMSCGQLALNRADKTEPDDFDPQYIL